MSMEDIQRRFPSLTSDNHKETSDEDFNYNCLAFVLGDCNNWWQPPDEFEKHNYAPRIYWPPGFPTDTTVDTVTSIIRLHGYTLELDLDSEPSAPAIAI